MRAGLILSVIVTLGIPGLAAAGAAATADVPPLDPAHRAATSAGDEGLDRVVAQRCPRALEARRLQHQRSDAHRGPPVKSVSRPVLQQELLLLARLDQDARHAGPWGPPDSAYMKEIDAVNLRRLKHIVQQDGFPTARMVGYDGLQAAWLLVQHADSDPAFQSEVLKAVLRRVRRGELDPQNYALLYDRVLLAEGKAQRYGTQYELRNNVMTVRELADPVHVDARRRALGLMPLADYECILKATNEARRTPLRQAAQGEP